MTFSAELQWFMDEEMPPEHLRVTERERLAARVKQVIQEQRDGYGTAALKRVSQIRRRIICLRLGIGCKPTSRRQISRVVGITELAVAHHYRDGMSMIRAWLQFHGQLPMRTTRDLKRYSSSQWEAYNKNEATIEALTAWILISQTNVSTLMGT